MKTKLFLVAIPCLILIACNGANKDSANDKGATSSAASRRDSLLNVARKNSAQDSANSAKDTGKNAHPKKGNVD